MIARVERRSTVWAMGLLTAYAIVVAPTLGQPLLESHAYRQTQTAFTGLLFAERGIDLLRPPLPILGPPGVLPLEFPLFQAMGSLVIDAGIPADLAMRLTGLACFLASAALLFLLVRSVVGALGAVVALAAYVFNGHALLYGRASLIEYLAVAGGLGFMLLASRWLDTRSRAAWVGALIAGSIGVLVKVTTGAFYVLPILLWRSPTGRWGFQRPSAWALVALVAAVGFAWSAHADDIRGSQPATEFLATRNQYGWLFGSLAQRLDPASWRLPLVALLALTGSGLVLWAIAAVRSTRHHRQRPFLLATVALGVAAPLTFFNLYVIHDYYWAAVAPVLALGIGAGAVWLASLWPVRWARLASVGLAGAWIATLVGTLPSWSGAYGDPADFARTERVAGFISEHSDADDWVVVDGFGWNSAFLYYARRQGFAVPDESTVQDTSNLDVDAILADRVYGPFIRCEPVGTCSVSDAWVPSDP